MHIQRFSRHEVACASTQNTMLRLPLNLHPFFLFFFFFFFFGGGGRGRPGGVGVMSSLHSQQIVGLNPGAASVVPERSLSDTITELPKAMVCGALSMGHCTLKTP